MKMADNSLMTFQNNCESINRNGVEVKANHIKDNNSNEDSANLHVIVNKQDNQPQNDVLQNSSDILTQGDVDELLAGENLESNNVDHFSKINKEDETIIFKPEKNVPECDDKEIDKTELTINNIEKRMDNDVHPWRRINGVNFIAKKIKRRSIKCLNKMQIMEDVREGCNVQPSSPGHAEQRADDECKVEIETHSENGYVEQNSDAINNEDNNEEQKDVKPSENEDEVAESNKTDFSETNNEENYSNASSPSVDSSKRKSDIEEFPVKRLKTEIHQNFLSRDKILNEFIEMADCNNMEQIHTFSEQLLAEIKTLNELAKEKEREWNNILHLKKIKEELLLRMQRKRQIMLINEKSEYSDLLTESQSDLADERSKSGSPHSILKSNLTNPQKSALRIPNVSLNGDKLKHRSILPKLPQNSLELNGSLDLRQAKQRPILDVQSIIADYRQRHPEAVPRRGRRIRNSQSDSSNKSPSNVLNFASMALGSGSQVRQNLQNVDVNTEFGMLLSSMNGNRSDYTKITNSDTSVGQDTTSFRDMLLQFAKLSQSERTELMQNFKPPPPYPEVTVHPVPTTTATPTNSLLHGILTKSPSKQNKTSFSPTLARLLTAPERGSTNPATSTPTMSSSAGVHPSNMSISEILSTSKARNEITITPVGAQYETATTKEEEEAEDSADRLVIDESNETSEARRTADNNSETGDEVPPCQGCNQKPAQFVCAGCGNQWYCSRDCQVSAWDEHSEVCSG